MQKLQRCQKDESSKSGGVLIENFKIINVNLCRSLHLLLLSNDLQKFNKLVLKDTMKITCNCEPTSPAKIPINKSLTHQLAEQTTQESTRLSVSIIHLINKPDKLVYTKRNGIVLNKVYLIQYYLYQGSGTIQFCKHRMWIICTFSCVMCTAKGCIL